MRKLKKAKGKKLDDVVARIIEKELRILTRDLTKEFDLKIDGIKTEFGQAIGEITQAAVNHKLDARTVATSVAKAFAPQLKDVFNKSFSQVGDDFLKFLGKSQRNL
jgi:tRNA A37 threonylcarbamoyltransferase TsaD